MSKLYFKIGSDWEEVVRLRNEIAKLKQELMSMDGTQTPAAFKALNAQLAASNQRLDELVTNAAKAGAEMETGFKRKIFDASQAVNGFTEKILAQKAVVKDIEADVKRLGDAYRIALKRNPLSANSKLEEYNAARKALDEEKAALFGLTQQQAEARLSVKKLRDEYALYNDNAKEIVESNNGIAISWKKALAVIGGAGVLKALGSEMIRVRGEFQSMQTAIETMVGKDMAGQLIPQIKELAKISPLTMSDMVGAEKMMLGFNIQAEDTIKYLKAISDISMGESSKFNSLTLAFSQMSAAGKLMGQDLNQMINAGFNPLQIISEKTGKSIATLKDEMSKGAVSAEMVQQAFIDATSAGGKFYNMSENASKTINGQLSMMQDALDSVFNELGTKSESVIMDGIQMTTSLIQNYETVGRILAGLVVTYGTYRTAVMLVTAAESKHTLVEIGLTNARLLARKAQLALNAAMLTNPYVLLATAVVGLGAAMWALSDSTTSAERALDSYNKKIEKLNTDEEDRKRTLEGLVSTINSEVEAETTKLKALKDIEELYPALFRKYVDEKGHIQDLTGFWKAYNEEVVKSRTQSKQAIVESLEQQVKSAEWAYNLAKRENNRSEMKVQAQRIEDLKNELANARKDVLSEINTQLEVENRQETQETTYQEDLANAKVEWEKAKKGYEALIKDQTATSKQVKEAKDKMETSEKAYKELGGVTGSSLTRQENLAKKQKENQEKLDEELLSIQRKNQQDEISLMEDGAEKKLAQIKADHEAQKQAIEKQMAELAKVNKEAGNTSINSNGLTAEQQTEIDKANALNVESRKKAEEEVYRAEAEAMRDYLKEYGTFQQQKLAIAEEYAEKIRNAQSEGERLSLERQKDSAVHQVDMSALSQKIDWGAAFGDLTGLLGEQMKDLLRELKIYVKTDKFKESDETDKKTVYDAIEMIEGMLPGGDGTLNFKQLQEQMVQLGNAVTKVRDAEVQQNLAYANLKKAQEDYEKAVKDGNEAEIQKKKLAVDIAKSGVTAADSNYRDATNELQNLGEGVKKSSKDTIEGLNAVASGLHGFASGTLKGSFEGIQNMLDGLSKLNIGGKIGSAVGKISETLSSAGVIGQIISAILSILDILKDGIGSLVSSIIDTVLNAVDGILDNILSGDIFVQIFSSIKNGIGNILNTVTFGGFRSWFGIGGNKKEVEEAINRLTDRNETLQTAIEDLTDEMKASKGTQSVAAYRDAYKYQKETIDNYKRIAQEQARYSGSHHSWNYYWGGFSQEQIDRLSGKIGRDWNGDIWNLTPEEMKMLRETVDMWETIQNTGKGGYGDRLTDKLNDYIDQAGTLEELTNELYEGLTGMSFDSMYDSFVDNLMDMKYDAKAASEDISEYFMRAMLSNKIGELYSEKLEDWWKKFGASMEDNELTEEERKALQDEYMQYVDEAMKLRDELAAATGYDKISQESYSQSSSSRGFQAMSQDTGEELNGRFTALQIAGEEIKNQNIIQSQSLNLLTVKADALLSINTETRNIADDTRDLIAQSYLELVQISENTGAIVKPIQQMQRDIAEVKKNTAKL
ncbi:tape measure protein [Phocaeicola vulgatus]|jgi:tape measure domain-containing protein|uniref:Tape measure protein n=2 Tax=Phocaeicola TaxID=909656 RepID=A0A6I1A213_PHOVU|nr:tape measure protein [Phocaeicola vulgatus]KAB6445319.1 tape measure protein [Phocaeicola vulgatus]KAB6466034.1 tape measure protein [Phocaeicola vulgatus]KAB6467307.1 tape measure protein [Phocaeicola vulgatus]KAB6471347.1 tape measure protein [Phocaeicola vulgatus]KAB6478933.1 tape measure protein [Phocaeicola vulgatus]